MNWAIFNVYKNLRIIMYPIFNKKRVCNIPAFFYPTTILLVDDDEIFLKKLTLDLKKHYKTVTFTNPNQAINFLTQKEGGSFFRGIEISGEFAKGILGLRKEPMNRARFEDVLVSVLDYDMPGKSGFDIWEKVGTNDYYESHQHAYILLTAKRYADFDKEIAEERIGKDFISKHDPKYLEYLLDSINGRSGDKFQGVGEALALFLTHDDKEKTSFLNDANFLPIFNGYIKEHAIVEGYLFDKQGSFMFLDDKAHLHWLFVRNENGVRNSIAIAKQYNAPQAIIEKLESKQFILSLYEKEDFESRKSIDWNKYVLKATVFKDEPKIEVYNHCPSDYYYAFTQDFPEHGIDTTKILSYDGFLKGGN